jgi:pimeloyl-ACP methyl ester carboxylesterase
MKKAALLYVLLAPAVCGCSAIKVSHVSDPPALTCEACALNGSTISLRSLQTLRELDLDTTYDRDRAQALQTLQALSEKNASPDKLFALAELSYLMGKEAERKNVAKSVGYYYLCAGYAYHYLFSPDKNCTEVGVPPLGEQPPHGGTAPGAQPWHSLEVFDPHFRLACDFYNAGLAKCLRMAQTSGRLDPGTQLRLPGPDGQPVFVTVVPEGFAWRPENFGPILFCDDYVVSGMENQHRGYGLGVALMGTLKTSPAAPPHVFYPHQMSFPATAFLRFDGRLSDVRSQQSGTLKLYNPLAIQTIAVASTDTNVRATAEKSQVATRTFLSVPLETDLTTPLAYFLSNSDWDCLAYEGFLRADRLSRRTGIYMFEPYQPGKIPVLMVHGLLSSPTTWAPLFNDLRADPRLRERFQFWFYLYPTGDSYLETAADLRRSLRELRENLDATHHDDALDQMVLVGHSMGGLISRLMTVQSGDDFWKLVSAEPLKDVKASADAKAELQELFYFEPLPFVGRVVFLGTPHRGSSLSPSPPARLVERFVKLPQRLVTTLQTVAKENPLVWPAARKGDLPTSVDLLDPKAPALLLLAGRPKPAPVHYHSIIGVLPHPDLLIETFAPGGDSKLGTDGIVPYTSAHLDGVDSEITVPADHSHVHQHPHSVAEVKRILLEHLAGEQINLTSVHPQAVGR